MYYCNDGGAGCAERPFPPAQTFWEVKSRSSPKGEAATPLLELLGQSDTPVVEETSPSMTPQPPSIIQRPGLGHLSPYHQRFMLSHLPAPTSAAQPTLHPAKPQVTSPHPLPCSEVTRSTLNGHDWAGIWASRVFDLTCQLPQARKAKESAARRQEGWVQPSTSDPLSRPVSPCGK